MISIFDACNLIFVKSGIKKFKGIFLTRDGENNLFYLFSENGFSSDITTGLGLYSIQLNNQKYTKLDKDNLNDFKNDLYILGEMNIPRDFDANIIG